MELSFDDIVNLSAEELPDELQLPEGTWRFRVKAVTPKPDTVLLTLLPVAACDDVDAEALECWEEQRSEDEVVFYRPRGNTVRQVGTQLKALCRTIGVKAVKELKDKEFYATISYDPNKQNPGRPWQRVHSFQSLEAFGQES